MKKQKIMIAVSYLYMATASYTINDTLEITDDELTKRVGISKRFLQKNAKAIIKELIATCIGVNDAYRFEDGFFVRLKLNFCGYED